MDMVERDALEKENLVVDWDKVDLEIAGHVFTFKKWTEGAHEEMLEGEVGYVSDD